MIPDHTPDHPSLTTAAAPLRHLWHSGRNQGVSIPDHTPDHPDREWLRALLAAGGISQREAARLLHYDERTLRKWCCGERPPTWSACELLRRLLKDPLPPPPPSSRSVVPAPATHSRPRIARSPAR